jgi:hypothetical protein
MQSFKVSSQMRQLVDVGNAALLLTLALTLALTLLAHLNLEGVLPTHISNLFVLAPQFSPHPIFSFV